jgi:RNA polymerase sigma-70 factor, ECF subfamily
LVTKPTDTAIENRSLARRQIAEDSLDHLGCVYRLALCLAGRNQAEAEKLVEDVVLRVVDNWDSPRAASDLRIRLLASCRSRYAERQRGEDNPTDSGELLESTVEPRLEALAATAPFAEIDAAGVDAGSLHTLADGEAEDAIAGLPRPVREAVVLSDLEGLSYSELAEVLAVETATAKGILFRGRRLLQQELYRRAIERGDLEPPGRSASISA